MEKQVGPVLIGTEVGHLFDLSLREPEHQAPGQIESATERAPPPMMIDYVVTLLGDSKWLCLESSLA